MYAVYLFCDHRMKATERLVRAKGNQEAKDVTLAEPRASPEVTKGKRPRTAVQEEWSECLRKGMLTRSHNYPHAEAVR